MAFYDKGELDQAIADYTEAFRLKPDCAISALNRGIVYEIKGDKIGAIADYRRALEIDPNLSKAREKLERLA